MRTHLTWSLGVAKLKKNPIRTAGFTLPAFRSASGFRTCPAAGQCAGWCYARQGRFTLGYAAQAYERNLASVRAWLSDATLATRLADDLRYLHENRCVDLFRIHVAGDFFCQAYLDAWCEALRMVPVRAYAYTKMHARLDWSKVPSNLAITQSFGGKDDALLDRSKPHSRVFPTHEERRAAGYADGTRDDTLAATGVVKQGLVHHGVRRLTEKQIIKLRVLNAA